MTLSRRVLRRGVNSPHRSPRRNNTSLRKKALIRQLSGDVQFGADSKANLKVVVRVRPFNQREQDNNARCILDVVDEHMLVFDPQQEDDQFFFKGALQRNRDLNKRKPKEQKFAFERVFTTDSTNEDIYNATTHDLLDTLLSGYNCSVFAYGATGAGKTFTMLGKEDCPGITFLTLMELYKRIDNIKEEKTCEVAVSYLEVYNETVHDLLITGKALNVQESGQQVMVPGLSLHKPGDAQELMEMLARGNHNRSQHPTDSNAESSRSHAVFQVFVKQRDRVVDNLKSNVIISKLSMIDLAGSERGAATGFKGARFREGASINKSLLALGNCINALADGLRHIPYRDSKLTRLLKDSLGGNCRSIMIAAVSPASTTYEDTFNTLRYANRAKTIKTTIKKNLMNVDQHVSNYVKIVEELREQVCSLKAKIKAYEGKEEEWEKERAVLSTSSTASPPPGFTLHQKQDLEARIADLESQLKNRSMEEGEHRVPEEEVEVEQQVEETIQEHKNLRCELLRLESSQREVEFKMNGCTARLNRMKIISFASQKLDKSIARCERTIRNLANRLAQVTLYKKEVQTKLAASVIQLQQMQNQLNSSLSQQHIDKMEANLAVRDYHQHCLYLGRLVGEAFTEQSSSEHLISQLLHATRKFYIQLYAYNQCSPAVTELFENVVEKLDESKIAWADQQGDGSSQREETSASTSTVVDVTPRLDVDYFTRLPISPTVTISPAVSQERPRVFRKSSIKSSKSSQSLPQLLAKCLASAHDPSSATLSLHSPLLEEQQLEQDQTSATSTTLATSVPKHIVPILPVLSTSRSVMEQLDDRQVVTGKLQLPVITTHLPMPTATGNNTSPQLPSESTYPGFSSMSQQCGTTEVHTVVEAKNTTELHEDIQPVDCSMNGTFSFTPAKVLNTTIDLSCPSIVLTHDALPGASGHEPTFSSSVIPPRKEESDASLFGFVSLTKQCGLSAVNNTLDKTRATELLEAKPPVDCSMNSTFSVTPAKMLNTTINLPSHLSKLSQDTIGGATHSPALRTLSILSLKPAANKVPQYSSVHNLTITKPLSFVSLSPATVTSQSTSSKLLNIPSQSSKRFRSASDGAQETESVGQFALDPVSSPMCHISSQEEQPTKSASRKLFQPSQPSLDSTFSVSDDLTGTEHTPGITVVKSMAPERAGSLEVKSSGTSEVQQRLPLLSVLDINDQAPLQGPSIVGTTTVGGTAMPPPAKFKISKRGMSHTPHKLGSQNTTPGKTAGARTTPTLTRGSCGSMRRSVSTPSLASPLPSTTKNPKPWKRKFPGLGRVAHRSAINLKSLTPIGNQENVPPSSARKNAPPSSVHRNTVASAAKHALNKQ